MSDESNRRPLASRQSGWANRVAAALAKTAITPNQVSQGSMVMAAISGASFYASAQTDEIWLRAVLLFCAGLFCQFRLLCNLFDGMLAIEAGKSAPDGPFWNEFPDRIADIFILVGAGYAAGDPILGWAASAFAVLTAYLRELGSANGMPPDFSGPMAKPHRMAAVTLGAVVATAEPFWEGNDEVLTLALWIVALGAALTSLRRARHLRNWLNAQDSS